MSGEFSCVLRARGKLRGSELFRLYSGLRISTSTIVSLRGRILQVKFRSLFVLLSFSSLATTVTAEPKLPHLFSDHMVFQRDVAIQVWGWADPGEAISVAFAGQTQQSTAGSDSRWHVELGFHACWRSFRPAGSWEKEA